MESKLDVICEDLSKNPICPHGPTLLFVRKRYNDSRNSYKNENDTELGELFNEKNYTIDEEYYACSAYRNTSGCKFYLEKSDYNGVPNEPKFLHNIKQFKKLRDEFFAMKPEQRSFCHQCNVAFNFSKYQDEHDNHDKLIGISDNLLKSPTQFLHPLSNDKAEAQYFFKQSTLNFFQFNLKKLKITKIVCIGVPRLHEYIKSKYNELKIRSILLDFDHRMFYFNEDKDFVYYNMFNNYFFEGEEKIKIFRKFLKVKKKESLLIVVDPPFGCRTEPLVHTLKEITGYFHDVNNFNYILPIFWIFPYYMEHYIRKYMPEMEMLDYKINYTNHESYSNDRPTSRKYGSPVRLFTNIPVDMIELPESEGYKFCNICCKWTGLENLHCNYCNDCASKNGETYRHCMRCGQCVKPNYIHCMNCQRCTQQENHNCDEYQKHISCWICRKRGHLELNCTEWSNKIKFLKKKKSFKKMRKHNFEKFGNIVNGKRICILCCRFGHNEMKCPKRKTIIGEIGDIE